MYALVHFDQYSAEGAKIRVTAQRPTQTHFRGKLAEDAKMTNTLDES